MLPGAVGGAKEGAAGNGTVLASRLAAALVHHEPGWRLPRHTALAHRYNVSPAEIENAVAELVSRHLIRRLPDGQLYRTSPAEYLIELAGVAGLGPMLDPTLGPVPRRGAVTAAAAGRCGGR
ncbi:MAG: GntR family transcriptional regulator [Actinomycetota bacterium]|nr:GntR family transcriptional regulator [Actinomycetota bacterium]